MTGKTIAYTLTLFVLIVGFSCVKDVKPELPKADPQLVVEAFLNVNPEPQIINLSRTQPYFDKYPSDPVLGAEVSIKDNLGNSYRFEESKKRGKYVWTPKNGDNLGGMDKTRDIIYTLTVAWEEESYTATSSLPKVPEIQRATIDRNNVTFFAADLPGQGNAYKIYVVSYAEFDTTRFSHGDIVIDSDFASSLQQGLSSNKDGVDFSLRVRQIPIVGNQVEIYAIPLEEALFIYDVAQQDNRNFDSDTGSSAVFQALFGSPPSNVYSNIKNSDPNGKEGVGCFAVANVAKKDVDNPQKQ